MEHLGQGAVMQLQKGMKNFFCNLEDLECILTRGEKPKKNSNHYLCEKYESVRLSGGTEYKYTDACIA